VEALVGCLTDEDASVRWQAAMGLGNIGDPRALPALAEAIRTDPGSSLLRGLMVEALGYMGGAGAIEALITVLKTDEPEVRRSVPRALYLTGDAEALKACMGAALEVGDEEAHRSAADLLSDLSDEDELQRLREERTHGFLSPYWQED